MVRKSMGDFIAVLRRAKGLTQAELADKLSVSDKTVSRWERGEGAPDISLIPIIAHIFGVTSDELLRGERNPTAPGDLDFSGELSKRGQKQFTRLLEMNLSKAKNQSLVSLGIMVTGLIGAMICNFGYNRGYLGFFVSALFSMTGILYGIIISNMALLKVSRDGFDGEELKRYKRSILLMVRGILILGVILSATSLPLILTGDPLFGVMGRSWLRLGLLYGIIALALCLIIVDLWDWILIRKGIYILGERENDTYRFNLDLKKRYGLILLGIFLITLGGHWFLDRKFGINEGDFLAHNLYAENAYGMEYDDGSVDYLDEYGNTIYEEGLPRENSGGDEGGVLYTYVKRLGNAAGPIIYSGKRGFFPFTIYNYRAYSFGSVPWGKIIMIIPNIGFFLVYLVEILAIIAIYYRKRGRE